MRSRFFPSGGGLFSGALILVMALIADPVHQGWVTVKVVLIVLSVILTLASLIGLVVMRSKRRHSDDHTSGDEIPTGRQE